MAICSLGPRLSGGRGPKGDHALSVPADPLRLTGGLCWDCLESGATPGVMTGSRDVRHLAAAADTSTLVGMTFGPAGR